MSDKYRFEKGEDFPPSDTVCNATAGITVFEDGEENPHINRIEIYGSDFTDENKIKKADDLRNYILSMQEQIQTLTAKIKELEAEREWVSVEDRLPKEGEIVFIYCGTHPEKFDHDYSALNDGSDRTEEALIDREWARKWFAEYPIKQGSLYMTAISGLRWRMRGCAPDSRYSFFGDEGVVTHWMQLPQSPKGE